MASALETAFANVEAKLVEITASPKPDYTIDGKTVKWADYFRMLTQARKDLREQIIAENPYLFKSQVL